MTNAAKRELELVRKLYPYWSPTSKSKKEQQIHIMAVKVLEKLNKQSTKDILDKPLEDNSFEQLTFFNLMGPEESTYSYIRQVILDEKYI